MNSYIVTLVDGKLVCQDLFNNQLMMEEATINFLNMVDSSINNKILLKGNKITIRNVNKGYSIDIQNFIQFYLSNYKNLLNNTVDTIKKNEAKIQKEKHKNKNIKKSIIAKVGISVAPIVMVSMLATSLDKKNVNVIENQPLNIEKIEDISTNTNDDINNIIKEDINIKENVIVDEDVNNSIPVAILNVEDNSNLDEIKKIQSKFVSTCEQVGKKWGISPNILLGLITQESHGNDVNLTQIEFNAWKDQVLNVYNYNDKKWVKVVLTNNPEKFKDVNIRITKDELNNSYTNIATAAILLNYSFNTLKTDNIFAGLDFYNKGYGNFYKNMNAMEASTNKSIREVLDNPTDTDLINYSYICNQGDPNYVCNVMQYIPNKDNGGIYFYRIDNDKEKLVSINLNNSLDNIMYAKNTR